MAKVNTPDTTAPGTTRPRSARGRPQNLRIPVWIGGGLAILAIAVGGWAVTTFDPQPKASESVSLCGEPPPVSNDEVGGKITAEAKLLGNMLASPELSKEISKKKTEIFSKYAQGERAIAFYQYQICALMMNDKTMPLVEKIRTLRTVQTEQRKPQLGIARIFETRVMNNKLEEGQVVVKSTYQRLDSG